MFGVLVFGVVVFSVVMFSIDAINMIRKALFNSPQHAVPIYNDKYMRHACRNPFTGTLNAEKSTV